MMMVSFLPVGPESYGALGLELLIAVSVVVCRREAKGGVAGSAQASAGTYDHVLLLNQDV